MSGDALEKNIPVLKKNLGITNVEAKVLLPVILGGNMTPGGIATLTGDQLGTVERALDRLVTKGFVIRVDGVVPIYRLYPASLAAGDSIDLLGTELEAVRTEFGEAYEEFTKSIEENAGEVLDVHRSTIADANVAFNKYENKALQTVQTQVDTVATLSTKALQEFTQSLEDTLEELATLIDTGLGDRLSTLQAELDKSQKQLDQDIKTITSQFSADIKEGQASAALSFDQLREKGLALIESAKNAVEKAIEDSQDALATMASEMESEVTSKSTEAAQNAILFLTGTSEDLDELSKTLQSEIKTLGTAGATSVKQTIAKGADRTKEEADFAKVKICEALEISESISQAVESWREEVSQYTESASQSLSSHLDQLEATGTTYLDILKTSLTGHLEKTRALLTDEYASLQEMAISNHSDLESSLSEARVSAVETTQKHLQADETQLEEASIAINSEVDKWSKGTIKTLDSRLTKMVIDIQAILDVEATKMGDVTDSINSKLKSAFNTAMSETSAKQEAALTAVRKSTRDFELNLDKELSEIIAGYTTTTRTHIENASDLYADLNTRLEEHLNGSVSKISGHSNRIQKEIDTLMQDQITRIDSHAQGIREEFHAHLEDVTRQFISFTQGLEATFNGFMASQTVEARDLISSVHTEFKGSLKSEMATLQEESSQLKLDFTAEFQTRVDQLVNAADKIKKALEDFSIEKRTEVSDSMAGALGQIEQASTRTREALEQMETITIAEFRDNLQKMSKEFGMSVAGAKQSIAENVEGTKESTSDSIQKCSTQARSTIDAYVTSRGASRQKLAASMNSDYEKSVARVLRKSSKNVEAFQQTVSEKESQGLESGRNARENAIAAIDSHKDDLDKALIGASERVTSAISKVGSSLDALGTKLVQNVETLNKGLQSAADESATQIELKGKEMLNDLEQTHRSFITKTESTMNAKLKEFSDSASGGLTRAADALSNLPANISQVNSEAASRATKEYAESRLSASESFMEAADALTNESSSTVTDAKSFISKSVDDMSKVLGTSLDDGKKASLSSIQYAFRKLESIGQELNTYLDSETSRLIEKAKSESTAVNSEVAASISKANNDTNEGISLLKTSRNDAFGNLNQSVDRAIRAWSVNQKQNYEGLKSKLEAAVDRAKDANSGAKETLEAVRNTAELLLSIDANRTWYVTGTEEINGHIMDMALRAEKSIIISVLDTSHLDLKKLAKVKAPRRKILIVPAQEEPDSSLGSLEGWRIWHTESPALIALSDSKEILIGGSTEPESAIALVSTEAAYLGLYRNFLGPQITQSRRKD
ncbi:MAG: hypothetical protein EAX95_13000 [Candidatus Thorarchaeota archaeon]|nr:hypothetical protein [Candidatus Thorarchaeota archaeon]